MNEMQVFNSEQFGQLRTITENDKTIYCGIDICTGLGYAKPRNAIAAHCRGALKRGVPHPQNPEKQIEMTFITEGDVYRLIAHSTLPAAEKFESWVFDEVLPSIRKTGGYIMGEEKMSDEELLASAVIMANRKLEERAARIKALEDEKARLIETNAFQAEQIEEMAPKASYYDKILATKDLVPITQIAKDYGMSAIEMNRFLHEHGYQYRRNKTWVLYDKYAGFGYTSSKTHLYEDKGGREHSQMSTQWTQAGRLFLYEELKKFEILPMVERGLI